MNYMKKYVKNSLILLVVMLPILIITLISCDKKEEKMIIISEKKQYLGITENEKVDLTIPLYIEKNKSFYFDKDKIKGCSLKDKNDQQIYEMQVTNINRTSTKLNYGDKDLYAYEFVFSFSYCTDSFIRVLDACLEIEYINGEQCLIDIGSVLLKRTTKSDTLNIKRVKPIVNDLMPINGNTIPTTTGLLVMIENMSNEEIEVTDIVLLNSIVVTNYPKVKKLDNFDYESNSDISDIIGEKYQLVDKNSEGQINYTIAPYESVNLLIPFNYLKLETVKETGLLVKYQCNNKEENTILNNTPLFNSSLLLPDYCIYAFVPN